MADINQVISLGVGTPSGIKEFLTFGLQIGAEVVADIQNTILRMTPAPGSRGMFINIQPRKMTPEPANRRMMVIKNG